MAKAKKVSNGKASSGFSIQPTGDRVLVRREEVETKTASGIIIPDTAEKEKSKRGTVIAVGEGRYGDEGDLIPMRVTVGAKVYFNAGWDNEVKLDGDSATYFLIKEDDVLAIIKN